MNGRPSRYQIDGHKIVLAAHDVKYSREDDDQCQAKSSKRSERRFDSGHRRQDQTDASKKLTDPGVDQAPRSALVFRGAARVCGNL